MAWNVRWWGWRRVMSWRPSYEAMWPLPMTWTWGWWGMVLRSGWRMERALVERGAVPWPYEVASGSKRLVSSYWARGETWDWFLKMRTWCWKRAERMMAKSASEEGRGG